MAKRGVSRSCVTQESHSCSWDAAAGDRVVDCKTIQLPFFRLSDAGSDDFTQSTQLTAFGNMINAEHPK